MSEQLYIKPVMSPELRTALGEQLLRNDRSIVVRACLTRDKLHRIVACKLCPFHSDAMCVRHGCGDRYEHKLDNTTPIGEVIRRI